jgi:hypothetical protein
MSEVNWDKINVAIDLKVRPKISPLPCPLCKSDQVQVCMDTNNPIKDFVKCRHCHCQAPFKAWQDRK